MVSTTYRATIFNPVSWEKTEMFSDGALVVSPDGTIEYCGSREKAPKIEDGEQIDKSGYIIMPGFIDAHCHVAQERAANHRYGLLLPWLNKVVFPLEINYTRKVALVEAPKFFTQLLSLGTTTAGAYVTVSTGATDEVFKAAGKTGIRGIIGKVMMDRNSPKGLLEETSESLSSSVSLCEKWHNKEKGRLKYAFTPRFALTCSRELMEGAGGEAADRGAHVMTHVSENKEEIKEVLKLFPRHKSYLEIYNDLGLLGQKTTLAHAIHMNKRDWDIIKEKGVGIAHCPSSNLLLESGILDISHPAKRDVDLGLGSDIGAGSDPALPVVAAWAVASQSARKVLDHSYYNINADLALYMLTLGGARALGIENETGNFEKGKEADFIVVDPRPSLPFNDWSDKRDFNSLIWALILRFRREAVLETFVRGKRVYAQQG